MVQQPIWEFDLITLNQQFVYPEIPRVTHEDGRRHYVCPDTGQHVPSVTTILDATADKSGLLEWRARVGDVKANQISKEATDLGSLMHEHLEAYIEQRERPAGNNLVYKMAERMANKIIAAGLDKVSEVWGIETPLYMPGLYAGTSDLIGIYDGQPAIMDYKTAKKIKKRSMIADYFDQMSAYALAHNAKYGTDIRAGVIFMVSRDCQYETFVCDGEEFKDHNVSFLLRLEKYLDQQDGCAHA